MAQIRLKGQPTNTVGDLPAVGSPAPDFNLTRGDLQDVSWSDFAGKVMLMNISPSLDTGVCAASIRRFNSLAERLPNIVIAYISRDLPFAQKRFCDSEGIERIVNLSALRGTRDFGRDYGVTILDGPLAGLFSRAVVVVDANGTVIYTEQVPEITQEPNYQAALKAVR